MLGIWAILKQNSWRNIWGWLATGSNTYMYIKQLREVHQSAKKHIYKWWNTFKIIFLSVKLWRLWIPYHLQYIKSSKKENLEKSLCVWDKVKNQYWMPAIVGPSGSFVISTGMILSWKSLHGIRNTSRSHSLWTHFILPSTNTG